MSGILLTHFRTNNTICEKTQKVEKNTHILCVLLLATSKKKNKKKKRSFKTFWIGVAWWSALLDLHLTDDRGLFA